nr:hypothetical protein GCM10020093_025530 [Planobispora longispora]
MTHAHISVSVEAEASPAHVFSVLTDWPRHDEWMVLTRARVGR